MRDYWRIGGWVVAVAVGLFLITTNVRIAANSEWLYSVLYDRHDVSESTGIPPDELRSVSQQIMDYFASDAEPLVVTAEVHGEEMSLFEEDEASHMADVKQLFQRTYRVQWLSAGVVLLGVGLAAYRLRGEARTAVASWVQLGAVLITGVIMLIGLASVVAFDQVFLLFHYIGFPQGNFTFDPRTDFLVQIFPFGFWQDITFVIAFLTLGEAAVLWSISRGLRERWEKGQGA